MPKFILQANKEYMKLEGLLKSHGIKRKWLAKQLGVHPNQVRRWIKGTNEPSIKNYKKIKKIMRSLRGLQRNLAE